MRKLALLIFIPLLTSVMAGCGGAGNATLKIGPITTPVSLTVTDTPPVGVQVLFFQLTITGAELEPGNVSLLPSTNSVPINVTQLQTETSFLGTANVPTGNYTSLVLTFSSPQLTIFNGTSASIGTCAEGTVCQLTPAATPLSLTFSSGPFPVTVAANTPLAFQLDIHLNNIIQIDSTTGLLTVNLAATNGVSISEFPPVAATSPVAVLGNLVGTVESVGSSQFTLQTGDGRTFTINTNSSTTYNFPSCTAENFTCLSTADVVKTNVTMEGAGALLANTVTYEQAAGLQVLEGAIVGLSTVSGNTVMQLILHTGFPPATSLPLVGNRAAVTIPITGVTFGVDSPGFIIPGGFTFAGVGDLSVGQEVQCAVVAGSLLTSAGTDLQVLGPLGPAPSISFTTSSVLLEPGQVTGDVIQTFQSNSSFTLQTFANFFLPPGPPSVPPTFKSVPITVQDTARTTYQDLTPDTFLGISNSTLPLLVSVEGWLFSTPTANEPITIVAAGVVGRPGTTPLF